MGQDTTDPNGSAFSRPRVFVSAKSGDYPAAAEVYRVLMAAGIPAFFSQESLPQLGSADYRRQIDRALDAAEHMVVVTSSVENVQASWVEAEWGFFINEKRSGRKIGNLMTVLVGDLKPADLPPSLRYYEAIPFDPSGLERLVQYVAGGAERPFTPVVPPPAPASREPERLLLRETATFGGPPLVKLIVPLPGEQAVATGGFDGAIRVYDVEAWTRRELIASARYWFARHEGLVTALAISDDGRLVVSGHLDGQLHVWEMGKEQELAEGMRHDSAIRSVAFSPDSHRLVTAGDDGSLAAWNVSGDSIVKEGRLGRAVSREPSPIVSLVALAGTETFVAGLASAAARRFTLQIRAFAQPNDVTAACNVADSFETLAASSDGRLLAAGGTDGTVRLYDFHAVLARADPGRPAEVLRTFEGHKKPISSIAFVPGGRYLVSCAMESKAIVWDLESGRPAVRLQGVPPEIYAGAVVLGNGAIVAAALSDGRVRTWERAHQP